MHGTTPSRVCPFQYPNGFGRNSIVDYVALMVVEQGLTASRSAVVKEATKTNARTAARSASALDRSRQVLVRGDSNDAPRDDALGRVLAQRVLARARFQFVTDSTNPGSRTERAASSLTDVELQAIKANVNGWYTGIEVQAADGELAQRTLRARARVAQDLDPVVVAALAPHIDPITQTAAAIVQQLNTQTYASATSYGADVTRLKRLVFHELGPACSAYVLNHASDAVEVEKVRKKVANAINKAVAAAAGVQKKQTDWKAARTTVPFEGFAPISPLQTNSLTNPADVRRPGIGELKTRFGFTDGEVQHAVNLIYGGFMTGAPEINAWLMLLDQMQPLWPQVKQDSAKVWLRKTLLLNTTGKTKTHLLGMYSELFEAHRILTSHELAPHAQLRMGKDKVRPTDTLTGTRPPITQDVDLSFHAADGTRHYTEVKAFPSAVVEKIGKDTHEQLLSHAAARDYHAGKASPRYAAGKTVVVTYATDKTNDWLTIFTSKAGRRLITSNVHLRVGAVHMDIPLLKRIQTQVNLDTFGMNPMQKAAWATANSGPGRPFHDPARYIAVLKR